MTEILGTKKIVQTYLSFSLHDVASYFFLILGFPVTLSDSLKSVHWYLNIMSIKFLNLCFVLTYWAFPYLIQYSIIFYIDMLYSVVLVLIFIYWLQCFYQNWILVNCYVYLINFMGIFGRCYIYKYVRYSVPVTCRKLVTVNDTKALKTELTLKLNYIQLQVKTLSTLQIRSL